MSINTNIQNLLHSPQALQLESPLEAQLLLAHVLGVSRTYLFTWPEKTLKKKQLEEFEVLLSRRLKGEPIAYLLGTKEFWSMPLIVSKEVLIPRPETELLVQIALEHCPEENGQYQIVDLGTGSGAIALALGKERKNAHIKAIDNSESSLWIAKQNARNCEIKNIEFILSDWFSDFLQQNPNPQLLFDIVVSNPPYIHPDDIHLQTDLRFEPQSALVSKPDGLTDLKQIIQQAYRYLRLEGWLMLEHGFSQAQEVQQFLDYNGYVNVQVYKDLAGLDRVTIGQKKEVI